MSAEDIVMRARALLSDASPGPWVMRAGNSYITAPRGALGGHDSLEYYDSEHLVCESVNQSDGCLITEAPTLIAALCDEVERLRKERP